MKRVAVVVVGSLLCGAYIVDVAAWGDHGHEIVARIAAAKVQPTTKARIVEILREAGDDQLHLPAPLGAPGSPLPSDPAFADAMAKMATWPDNMPNGKGATGPWHYIDYGLFEGSETTANRCTKGCVTQLIPRLIANIKASKSLKVQMSGSTTLFDVSRQLRFLIHFFGDIHQPLHAVSTLR